MWFWQELTRGNSVHIPCLDKDFWTPENIERFGDRHYGYFGKRPWKSS